MIREERPSVPPAPEPRGQDAVSRPPAGLDGTPAGLDNAALAYGPDDPGYGPPSADWYEREEAARRREVEDELRLARGPFEPLPPDHVVPEAPVDEVADTVDISRAGRGDGPALDRIKDLYTTAEKIGDSGLDEHFEQLLARQRQLIREYFAEPEARKPAVSAHGASAHRGGPHSADMSLGVPRGRR